MKPKQLEAAKSAMISWLAHPQELGTEPVAIECAGTFELHDMTYYMFKYKKTHDGEWLLAVNGGYEGTVCQIAVTHSVKWSRMTNIQRSPSQQKW